MEYVTGGDLRMYYNILKKTIEAKSTEFYNEPD
jgi:hypothetical protein